MGTSRGPGDPNWDPCGSSGTILDKLTEMSQLCEIESQTHASIWMSNYKLFFSKGLTRNSFCYRKESNGLHSGCTNFSCVLKPKIEKMGTLKKMGTQKLKKVPMGTEVPKWGPMWEQWRSDQLLFYDVDQTGYCACSSSWVNRKLMCFV